jgi:hypothetical protein
MSLTSITLSSDAQASLRVFMQQRGIESPDSAIELALRESLARNGRSENAFDFRSLIGIAAGEGANPQPRFQDDDALWDDGKA